MGDNEIKGFLIIKKDRLAFQSKYGLGKANLDVLKKLDEELFKSEIETIENRDDWEGYIDFYDIIDVRVLIFESMEAYSDTHSEEIKEEKVGLS